MTPAIRNKKLASTTALLFSVVAAAVLVNRLRKRAMTATSVTLHPTLDSGIKRGSKDHQGGRLRCHCRFDPVEVDLKSNVLHNHACGCSKCWKPEGAVFSIVGVVPRDQLEVTASAHKLRIIDESAAIQRYACTECGVHLYGRIEKPHPFHGLDFVHTELSDGQGWQEPQFAAFVSSIIEQGYPPVEINKVRERLKSLGLETYDTLSPQLMDLIASWTYEQSKAKRLS
ncbi:glutathione-dependent formaldehyde-activating enzyme protein [Paramyrothecium foliicola]|nr:glutathione-dependent formaldehyde-activating enzyme protein [Paramyrothecium foliicola]